MYLLTRLFTILAALYFLLEQAKSAYYMKKKICPLVYFINFSVSQSTIFVVVSLNNLIKF